jgi:eukaryotic-like serine/threonine-protein kinase
MHQGLGEAVASASRVDSPVPLVPEVMAADTPPEPLPGQTRPDAKGRCPLKRQVAINGGCWVAFLVDEESCEASIGQMYQGSCYMPAIPPGRPSTSTVVK